MSARDLIRNLRRDPEGFWRATIGPNELAADLRYGSWQVEYAGARYDVLPPVAAELQSAVGRIERAERHERARKLSAEAAAAGALLNDAEARGESDAELDRKENALAAEEGPRPIDHTREGQGTLYG